MVVHCFPTIDNTSFDWYVSGQSRQGKKHRTRMLQERYQHFVDPSFGNRNHVLLRSIFIAKVYVDITMRAAKVGPSVLHVDGRLVVEPSCPSSRFFGKT